MKTSTFSAKLLTRENNIILKKKRGVLGGGGGGGGGGGEVTKLENQHFYKKVTSI